MRLPREEIAKLSFVRALSREVRQATYLSCAAETAIEVGQALAFKVATVANSVTSNYEQKAHPGMLVIRTIPKTLSRDTVTLPPPFTVRK